jgi:hypothetical protein
MEPGAVGPVPHWDVTEALTVTTIEDVSVRVMTLVESPSVADVHVEFSQEKKGDPIGSTPSAVVPVVPVKVG